MKIFRDGLLSTLFLFTFSHPTNAQTDAKPAVPDWALPGSATHKQVPPPPDFHRAPVTTMIPLGLFQGQSDVGAALVSAGYNVWYNRDEFRYVWKKMSGDVSLAADPSFPDTAGYNDRKAVLIIRQSLDDDATEAVVALHGAGLMHLAWRAQKGEMMQEVRVNHRRDHTTDSLNTGLAKRIGIEKHGDAFAVFISMHGEPMHQIGDPIQLHLNGPFYVGIGFCSHLPATTDTTILSHVLLVNAAGKIR
jgi:hypothetical protein